MSFENENGRTSHSIYYLPKVQIKDYNVKIDDISFFDQPVNKNIKTYGNAIKIATGQGDNYTTGCLLDYRYLKEDCKMIPIELGKQQALDADPTSMRQINLTASLYRAWNTTIFFIDEKAKEIVLNILQGTVRVLQNLL